MCRLLRWVLCELKKKKEEYRKKKKKDRFFVFWDFIGFKRNKIRIYINRN